MSENQGQKDQDLHTPKDSVVFPHFKEAFYSLEKEKKKISFDVFVFVC